MSIRSIETQYAGCLFRSRLEARWAVFFDALNIKWEYEHEGFDIEGTPYLPDFWLPTFHGGMFAEVKPIGGDFTKAVALARHSGWDVWLCEGTPAIRAYHVASFSEESGDYLWVGIPCADHAEGEDRMFSCPGYENDDLSIDQSNWFMLKEAFPAAVARARSARFE